MSGLGRVVRSGIGRRRVQTTVLAVTALVATAASTLGLGLLVASSGPFDAAFSAASGAHLRVDFAAAATPQQLGRTAELPEILAAAGPFRTAQVNVRTGRGTDLGLLTVAGRVRPDAAVDELTLTAGRWVRAPGEVVLDPRDLALGLGSSFLGMRLDAQATGGPVTLTVVGLARSVTHTANAWALPGVVAGLGGTQTSHQMLYRVRDSATVAGLAAAVAAINAAVPQSAVTDTGSYLAVRQSLTANAAAFVPFVVAFGVLAMVLSMVVIGLVVAGTVGAAGRRIGILKAVGFTPWQVARSYLAQVLVPTSIGMVAGAIAAMLLARSVLAEMDQTYGAPDSGIPVWVVASVVAGGIALVVVSSLVPALHLARRPAARTLRPGGQGAARVRGRWAGRMLARLPLPRSVGLGLGAPLRRPSRSAAMAVTVLAGSTCLTFAVGLASSLGAVQHSRDPLAGAAVQVGPAFDFAGQGPEDDGPPPHPVLGDPAAVRAAVASQPDVAAMFGLTDAMVGVAGLTGSVDLVGLTGNSSFTHHQMVAGWWLSGAPGEAVLPTRALEAAGLGVGDEVTLTSGPRSTAVTVVGEVFDLTHDGSRIYTTDATLSALHLDAAPQQFFVALRPGADVQDFLDSLGPVLTPLGAEADVADDGASSVLVAMNAIAALLAGMLVLVAVIGVVNTVMLQIRERIRDIGVFKALGMTPAQTLVMVITSVGGIGLVFGAIGVPLGIALHHRVVPAMGATAGAVLTPGQVAVYGVPVVIALVLGGLLIAVAGALGPAGWAARSSSASGLRTE